MIKELQKRLKEQNIKFYYVPTDDDHQSEIVGEHDQFRKYLSGFTGSAGVLVVGQEEAWLWTDGRYFIQAEKELYPGIKLMKMGNADVPSVKDFLIDHLDDGDVLGFNGKVTTASFIIDLDEGRETDFELKDIDITDVWTNRPERSHEPAYIYDVKYHGKSTAQKQHKGGQNQDSLFSHKFLRFYRCFVGAICHSSQRFPRMVTLSVRFMESIPAGVQQSRSHM